MDKKYKLINKSNRVIGVSVNGMEQVFNLPPNGEDILLDNYFINHLNETIKIFGGDIVVEEIVEEVVEKLSRKELLNEHTILSQELQPEFYVGDSLFNEVTDEGEIIPITEVEVGTTEININKNVDEDLNQLYVSLKTGSSEDIKAELVTLSDEEIENYLKNAFNFEDTEPNIAIVNGIKEEIEFSKKNVELLEKLKDFNHDDVSILDADELSESNYPEDEELVGDVTISNLVEEEQPDSKSSTKRRASKKK